MKTIKILLFVVTTLTITNCITRKQFFKAFDFKASEAIMIDSVLVERMDCKSCQKDYFLNVKTVDEEVVQVVRQYIDGVQHFDISNKCQYALSVGKVHNDRDVIKNVIQIINRRKKPN